VLASDHHPVTCSELPLALAYLYLQAPMPSEKISYVGRLQI